MKMYDTPQPVERYLNVELECDCGRTHYAPIKAINISSGALESLPGYVAEYGYAKPYILCDKITWEIAGKRCEELLKKAGFQPTVLIIRHLGFDEATLGEIVLNKPDDCDLMIGVGTGSITDMLRFSSFKLGLPCFTVATGAPMDGFSASVGIMNVNNLKATMPAHSTEVIIGDTDILKSAPYRMTIAGFADLIGKLNALDDWHLAVMINGDHYCKKIDDLVTAYVEDILKKAEAIKARDPEAIRNKPFVAVQPEWICLDQIAVLPVLHQGKCLPVRALVCHLQGVEESSYYAHYSRCWLREISLFPMFHT